MFCPNCGKDFISKEVNFCPDCGKNLSNFKDSELEKQNSQPIEKIISEKSIQDHTLSKSKMANEIIEAIDKGYTSGSKSEPDTKQESTNQPSELNQKETSFVTKKLPKQRKWGWGWYIVAFIIYKMIEADKVIDDNLRNAISILALISSVLIYFLFRNRFFKSFPNIYLRSISAGFMSIIITIALVILFIQFLPSQSNVYNLSASQRKLYSEFSTDIERANLIGERKVKEYNLLMADFVYEPSANDEVQNNIIILEKNLIQSNFVDSIALPMYARFYNIIVSVEKNDPKILSNTKINSELIQSIIEKLILFADKNQSSSLALIDYYKAWIDDSAEMEELWNIYEEEFEKLTVAKNAYFELNTYFSQLLRK